MDFKIEEYFVFQDKDILFRSKVKKILKILIFDADSDKRYKENNTCGIGNKKVVSIHKLCQFI